jgi:hypothetical protein
MMPEETSLSLAEDWVRECLEREVFEQAIDPGEEIEVSGLDQCDCVPVQVAFDVPLHKGSWRLIVVRELARRKLVATYKWEPR